MKFMMQALARYEVDYPGDPPRHEEWAVSGRLLPAESR
jgi:hypothetical protein